jgi:hypothetical protein
VELAVVTPVSIAQLALSGIRTECNTWTRVSLGLECDCRHFQPARTLRPASVTGHVTITIANKTRDSGKECSNGNNKTPTILVSI